MKKAKGFNRAVTNKFWRELPRKTTFDGLDELFNVTNRYDLSRDKAYACYI